MNNGSDGNNGSNGLITIAPIIRIALIVRGRATDAGGYLRRRTLRVAEEDLEALDSLTVEDLGRLDVR